MNGLTFGIGFILLLLALGGFAAYQGDRVGMAVGRKRLTIFGLRPKYTSRIVTILTGIIIVSITMASVLLISHTARQSLFGLEELQLEISSLTRQLATLEDRQLRLLNENTSLLDVNLALLQENELLQNQNAGLRELNLELEAEQEALEMDIVRLRSDSFHIYGWVLQQPLIYKAQQVIDTYVVDVPGNREQLEVEVRKVLDQLNAKVLADGAGESERPGWALILDEVDESGMTIITEEEHIQQLVDSIWFTGLDSVVISVRAKNHSLQTLPVVPDFEWLLVNHTVYRKGSTVDSRIFDGNTPGRDLFNQVWSWLQVDVNRAAIESGLLGQPDGTVTAPMDPGLLYEVVENIRIQNGLVRVRAVAAKDVQTSDELPLTFEYEPL